VGTVPEQQLMYRSFVFDDENEFVLNFMQLVRSHWRDPRAPSENLREYHQRFSQHLRMASSYYDNMVRVNSLGLIPRYYLRYVCMHPNLRITL
jgi:hypothetical protein